MNIDLTGITWGQMLLVTLTVAAVDTLSGIFSAIGNKTFSWGVVAEYLTTHVLRRVFPIVGLSFLSQTLPGTTGQAVWGICLVSLAAYVAETVASVSSNLGTPSQAPVVEAPPVVPPSPAKPVTPPPPAV